MTGSQTADLQGLLEQAQRDDNISLETLALLSIPDLGQKINNAMGVPADNFQQSEVVLVGVMVDDSSSIDTLNWGGGRAGIDNAQAIRDGHNTLIRALTDSKQQDNILFMTQYLNGHVLNPFGLVTDAKPLDDQNYTPNKGTPLYDQTMVFLGSMLAKAQEFSDAGVPCRAIALILTDGADMHSRRNTAEDCAKLIGDLLRQESYIIAFMGVQDPNSAAVDFHKIAAEMGVKPAWIMSVGTGDSEIRKACQVFSQSAVRASQTAAGFSQQVAGGFGSP